MGAALLDHHLHGAVRHGEADAFGKGAAREFGFFGSFPFPVDAGEPSRIEHAIGGAIQHLKIIFSEIGIVQGAIQRARPGTLESDPIERKLFLGLRAGVDIVQPQRSWSGYLGGDGNGREQE